MPGPQDRVTRSRPKQHENVLFQDPRHYRLSVYA